MSEARGDRHGAPLGTVLVTGAAGTIGRHVARALCGAYPALRLTDNRIPSDSDQADEFAMADLTDPAQLEAACAGVDAIVHLGGVSAEGPWEAVLDANIVGCYNLFEAARAAGVKRVVFASSHHVMGFYPRSRRIGAEDAVRPDSRYGVSKAFGEALAAMYAYKHDMRNTCLRIGLFADRPRDRRELSIWIEPDDLVQLVRIGLDHPDIRSEIFYGVSDNERGWWDNEAAFRFGYRPRGRAEAHCEEAMRAGDPGGDPVAEWYQGAHLAGDGHAALPTEKLHRW